MIPARVATLDTIFYLFTSFLYGRLPSLAAYAIVNRFMYKWSIFILQRTTEWDIDINRRIVPPLFLGSRFCKGAPASPLAARRCRTCILVCPCFYQASPPVAAPAAAAAADLGGRGPDPRRSAPPPHSDYCFLHLSSIFEVVVSGPVPTVA